MPKRVPEAWRRAAFEMMANHEDWSAARITRELEDLASEMPAEDGPAPSETTVRGWKREDYPNLSEEGRRAYRYLRWPESFEPTGPLPAESARVVLDEAAFWLGRFGRRLSVRRARWYWRLHQSAPDAPREVWRSVAGTLAAVEILGSQLREKERSAGEWLMFRAWEPTGDGRTHGADAYERALADGRISERWDQSLQLGPDTTVEAAGVALAELTGLTAARAESLLEFVAERMDKAERRASQASSADGTG